MTRAPGVVTALAQLRRLHSEVDAETAALARRHAGRLQCGHGCCQCCPDDLSVFEVEAERIRRRHDRLLNHGRPHPPGRCAFLDALGACRIYAQRPYVCRTQGLPLRWLDVDASGTPVEWRDICPLNESNAEPLERLAPADCWTIGPHERRLAELQAAFREAGQRLRLRDLFRPPPP